MKANDNEILTIAGKRVRVEYKECRFHPCGDCCLDKSGKCLADRECLAFGNFPGKMAYFVPAEESEPKNWPAPKEQPEVASSLRDETGRLYEDIDTPFQHYAEEHFDYNSEWDSLTPKDGRPFSPADLEAAILFGYNLNPKHK